MANEQKHAETEIATTDTQTYSGNGIQSPKNDGSSRNLQVETMALTRSVPVACEWIVAPFLKSIPRGTMSTFLSTTRAEVPERSERSERLPPLTTASSRP